MFSGSAFSQDLFEAQVYDSQTVPPGQWEIDAHFLMITQGAKEMDGSALPTDQQFHAAIEVTHGFADEFELGGYLLFARTASGAKQFAGARLRPRFRAPDSWGLPVGVSLSFEFGFPKPQFEPDPFTLEIRPIIDKTMGRWSVSINPVLTRALRGPDVSAGVEFEPSTAVTYEAWTNLINIGIAYYGAWGPLAGFRPARDQVHILQPNVDIITGKSTVINIGFDRNLSPSHERSILTARLSWFF